mmetsp:Transcript_16263/g.65703  ORF Transcript_16263/g.65703 Transcript_16263/m.65703 type:complete len:284 (-) Transcript_16263:1626-2477(-)
MEVERVADLERRPRGRIVRVVAEVDFRLARLAEGSGKAATLVVRATHHGPDVRALVVFLHEEALGDDDGVPAIGERVALEPLDATGQHDRFILGGRLGGGLDAVRPAVLWLLFVGGGGLGPSLDSRGAVGRRLVDCGLFLRRDGTPSVVGWPPRSWVGLGRRRRRRHRRRRRRPVGGGVVGGVFSRRRRRGVDDAVVVLVHVLGVRAEEVALVAQEQLAVGPQRRAGVEADLELARLAEAADEGADFACFGLQLEPRETLHVRLLGEQILPDDLAVQPPRPRG